MKPASFPLESATRTLKEVTPAGHVTCATAERTEFGFALTLTARPPELELEEAELDDEELADPEEVELAELELAAVLKLVAIVPLELADEALAVDDAEELAVLVLARPDVVPIVVELDPGSVEVEDAALVPVAVGVEELPDLDPPQPTAPATRRTVRGFR